MDILIIDDQEDLVDIMEMFFSTRGYTVTAVTSSNEALNILKGGREFDFIICDQNMPEVKGTELFQKLNESELKTDSFILFSSFLDSVSSKFHVYASVSKLEGLPALDKIIDSSEKKAS